MKRYLKHDRYRLSEHEAGNLWYAIRRELNDKEDGAAQRPAARAWRPMLTTAAVTMVAVVAVVSVSWWLADRDSSSVDGCPLPDGGGIAALESPGQEAAPVRSAREPAPASAPAPAVDAGAGARQVVVAEAPGAVADAQGVLTGRVSDRADGAPIAHAAIRLVGTARGVDTDSTGAFRFDQLEPGRRYELQVTMLGYSPLDVAVEIPVSGQADLAFSLDPVVVATAQPFDVTGEEYTVEIKSAVNEHRVTGETFDKYAIESVDDAVSKQAGVVYRAGELYVRGGRSGEVPMQIDGVALPNPLAAAPGAPGEQGANGRTWGNLKDKFEGQDRSAARAAPPAPGSITGGTTPPNGERFESMYFEHAGVNPFVATDDDALSTFALDVDNASFALARSYLERGELPPAAAIRVEEFVNAVDAGWPPQGRETFRIGLDGGPSRFGEGYHLLRVGIVGRSVGAAERKPANLVFVVDVSGSMDRENRLGAVRRSLRVLVDELGEGDRVGIVTYGSLAEIRLPLVDASRRDEILAVIGSLRTTGATNAAAGLQLGYDMARRSFEPGRVNRVVLCSDGVANAGRATDAEGILDLVRRGSDDGITLSTVGFGMGNYNDVLMEQLANRGDGNYFYVDSPREAERVFRENLTGLLQTVARQAKVQVEFDPRRVSRWRLLGYENRDVADRDFRNDAVDAGEVGAGHQVTALYELKLAADGRQTSSFSDEATALFRDGPIGVVRLRWEAPEHDTAQAGRVTEVERPIEAAMFSVPDRQGPPHRRAQALAAEFAEILRGSFWAKESRLSSLVPVAEDLARELPRDQAVQDLARMIRRAADLRADDREWEDR